MKVVRQSNFELLRIICMLMIVSGHIHKQHGIDFAPLDFEFSFPKFIQGFMCVAVNTFVLISGYWGIKFRVKKLIKIEFQVLFYSILILFIMTLLGFHQFEFKHDLFYFLPVISKRYWFVTCYITLFFISPILNLIKESFSSSDYKKLLLSGFVIIYLWPTFNFLINAPNLIEDAGYGIVNFIYLYFLGDYIHRFFSSSHSWKFYFSIYLAFCTLLGLTQLIISILLGFDFSSFFSYNTLFIFFASVSLFIAFTKISIQSNWINQLAIPCLAVYLIHFHPLLWSNLCSFLRIENYHGLPFLFLLIWLPISVYLVCFIIETTRSTCFGKIEDSMIEKIRIKLKRSSCGL